MASCSKAPNLLLPPALRKGLRYRNLAAAGWGLLYAVSAFAQEEGPHKVDVPNPMGAHTWFIILAVGAFLAWCISYCLQIQKEGLKLKPQRGEFLRKKEEILNLLADLESQKEAGTLTGDRYDRDFRKAKSRLSQILARLEQTRDAVGR